MKCSLLLLPLSFLLSGCGRAYNLMGKVILFDVSPSAIAEVDHNLIPRISTPINNANVTLFHELRGQVPKRNSIWKKSVKTDQAGYFILSNYAIPGTKNLVGLEVTADGYDTAFTTYVDHIDPDEQYFLVTLRKKI
jgi:hypothetical protein